jgi:hypothetical protein
MFKSIRFRSNSGNVAIMFHDDGRLDDIRHSSGVHPVELSERGLISIPHFVSPGEDFELVIFTTGMDEIVAVAVKCFVGPPPPEYRPCSDCGVVWVKHDQLVKITANKSVFEGPKALFLQESQAVELIIGKGSARAQQVRLGIKADEIKVLGRRNIESGLESLKGPPAETINQNSLER